MIRHAEFFAGLSDDDVAALLALGTSVVLGPGDVLFRIGDDAAQLYLVRQGVIELAMPIQVEGHDEDVGIEQCPAGEALGWSTLVPPHRFTLKGTARQRTELVAFPRPALLAHFAQRPEVGYIVLRNVAAMLGRRLQVFQAMWLREMQHVVDMTHG
jgi:CRP/FNR family cyclic AMP-dependent transcriptional regulator